MMRKKDIFVLIIAVIICTSCKSSNDIEETASINAQIEADQKETPVPITKENPGYEDISVNEVTLEPTDNPNPNLIESFQPICQYPELPTGCEITSLTMVLNYNGISVDKCDISDNYLDKGAVGTVDFRVAFEGDPRDENSYGCYSPVIANTANKYLQSIQSGLEAIDISGTEFADLFLYVDAGIPVIVWGTLDCAEGHYSVTWDVNGSELTWYTPEHCMVLIGYEDNKVWVADPVYGNLRNYDMDIFKNRYEALYKQAVVIQ